MKNTDLLSLARRILTRLEWSRIYSYCTGWNSCPICGGIKPGMGYDPETDTYPTNSGHHNGCELRVFLDETKDRDFWDSLPK